MVVTEWRCSIVQRIVATLLCSSAPLLLNAAVLPEERADLLYHSYDGGGIEINGPSLLVRKQLGNQASVSANYYVDSITSASIDVEVLGASEYSEERVENSLGFDYLRGKTIMSLAYTSSSENDFDAKSAHFSVSQSMFGDLTTVSMGYSRGWDTVRKTGDETFEKEANRQNYRLGISQILSKNLLLDFGVELITDEGFLNNPYRAVRYVDGASTSFQPELYPNTRTSNSVALRTIYYLPYRASVHGEYRLFSDSWGIKADTVEIGYTHPFRENWIFDIKYRVYNQTQADFYSDLFPFIDAQNFLARDKELSTYNNQTVGVAATYKFARGGWGFIDKGTLNASYDLIQFDYDNFRDARVNVAAGTEPLYSFKADVIKLFVSIWY
ncbi:MAG: DUF3570 domain-containing protein [Gammaproteobacteria bacterium]|nr:DUF3570 domain-containing protein [Gammaproteobacteria bacterium]